VPASGVVAAGRPEIFTSAIVVILYIVGGGTDGRRQDAAGTATGQGEHALCFRGVAQVHCKVDVIYTRGDSRDAS
jgi:hypothetical protein